MTGSWLGEVVVGPGWLRYEGPVVSTSCHAHHAVQIIDAVDPVVIVDSAGRQARASLMVIPANTDHELLAAGQRAVMTYLEPTLVTIEPGPDPAEWVQVAEALGLGLGVGRAEEQVGLLLRKVGQSIDRPADGLMMAAAEEVRRRLPGTIRLPEIAAVVAMSPSRLTHRFTAARGIALGRWVLWERLQLAALAVAQGDDLTTAAHIAGFADSSHLHRTFRRMFGLAPSDVAGVASWRLAT